MLLEARLMDFSEELSEKNDKRDLQYSAPGAP